MEVQPDKQLKEAFSVRYGARRHPSELIYDRVPDSLREAFIELLKWGSYGASYKQLYREYCLVVGEIPDEILTSYHANWEPARREVERLVRECLWYEFYDLCEVTWSLLTGSLQLRFTNQLNRLLMKEGLGYELREGKIEQIGSDQTNKKMQRARVLLKEDRFEGADLQFEKAIRFLNARPEPDTENCVKEAVGSVEAVARILSGKQKATLSKLLEKEPFRSGLHPTLIQMIDKLYAYRGDAPGVSHGMVGKRSVSLDEAQLVLELSGSVITYLVNKFGKLSR